MDIAAVLTAAPTAAVPAEGAPAAPAEGDAFAGLLAALMGSPAGDAPVGTAAIPPALPAMAVASLPTPVLAGPTGAPVEVIDPAPVLTDELSAPPVVPSATNLAATEAPAMQGAVPPLAEAPAAPAMPESTTGTTGSPPEETEDPASPAPPRRAPGTKTPRAEAKAPARGRPKPPEAPPPDGTPVQVAPEKEAKTTAPNAPVPPLDRTSEPTTAEFMPIVTPTAPVSAPVALTAAPPSASQPSGDSGTPSADAPQAVASPVVSVANGPVAAIGAGFEPTTFATDAAPRLASAPDLEVVPQVVVEPIAVAANPPPPLVQAPVVPAPNARVLRVAQAAQSPAPKAAMHSVGNDAPTLAVDTSAPKANIESTTLSEVLVAEPAAKPEHDAPEEDGHDPSALATPALNSPKAAATERPEPGTDRPSVDRHLVVRQVADRIESLVAARPRDGVTVHLEPRDLGTVTLVVKGLAHALDVQVSASDERVRQSLDAARPELAQALAPRGIELRDLRVAPAPTGTGTAANPNGGNPNANPEGRPRPQSAPTYAKPKATEDAPVRNVRRSGRGVDLLV